jgi:hypothetical protein
MPIEKRVEKRATILAVGDRFLEKVWLQTDG